MAFDAGNVQHLAAMRAMLEERGISINELTGSRVQLSWQDLGDVLLELATAADMLRRTMHQLGQGARTLRVVEQGLADFETDAAEKAREVAHRRESGVAGVRVTGVFANRMEDAKA